MWANSFHHDLSSKNNQKYYIMEYKHHIFFGLFWQENLETKSYLLIRLLVWEQPKGFCKAKIQSNSKSLKIKPGMIKVTRRYSIQYTIACERIGTYSNYWPFNINNRVHLMWRTQHFSNGLNYD